VLRTITSAKEGHILSRQWSTIQGIPFEHASTERIESFGVEALKEAVYLCKKHAMKDGVFCDVTPYGSCKNRRVGGT
jgi:hypothetical protein